MEYAVIIGLLGWLLKLGSDHQSSMLDIYNDKYIQSTTAKYLGVLAGLVSMIIKAKIEDLWPDPNFHCSIDFPWCNDGTVVWKSGELWQGANWLGKEGRKFLGPRV